MTYLADVLLLTLVFATAAIFFLFLEGSLRDSYQPPPSNNSTPWKRGVKINWPEMGNDSFVAYVCAPVPSKEVLERAKDWIDIAYPFRPAPYGGTFCILRRREYYLNQYLWFYGRHGYLPTTEVITDPYPWRGFTWDGPTSGYEPHKWISINGEKL